MSAGPLSLDPCFGKLGRDIERFANRTRRLVAASRKYRAALLKAAEWSGGAAPLDVRPSHPTAALAAIDKFARTHREDRASLMGAYFAHHHLRAQAELSQDMLRQGFSKDRVQGCRRLYARADEERRVWISSLLELLIQVAAPELSDDDYAAFNVGALTDHEDVDLAFVAASEDARDTLAQGFASVAKTFVRFASKIQLFLTEQFETPRTSALIEEYERFFLEDPAHEVVSATQLLGAQHLAGSTRLARALEERVIHPFYAAHGDPTVHQSFLRASLVELRHHLFPHSIPGVLSPKREVYVPSKLVVAAMRIIHGVREPRPLEALEILASKDPEHAETHRALADAFVENEVLRALLFLYVTQGDDLDLADDAMRHATRRVAVLLGLGERGRHGAELRLAGLYMDLRARALRAAATLSLGIARHLGRVSQFRRLFEHAGELAGPEGNLVLALGDALEGHRSGVFWDEIVELLGQTPVLAERFVLDFARIEPEARTATARRWVRMMCEDAASLVELLVLFPIVEADDPRITPESSAGTQFFDALFETLRADLPLRLAFIERLDAETRAEALHRLATAYPVERVATLADLIEGTDAPQSARVARTIRAAIILVHHASNALGRLSARVLGRAPEFVQRLGDPRRMKELASELLVRAGREPVPRERIELLGDAFDVASLRSALLAILDAEPTARDAEYTQAADQYVRELVKVCLHEVEVRSPRPLARFAVYATGGFGRGEAFGADWDYIALVEDEDPSAKAFYGKVLQRVSGAMARRGLIPHNRFTDHFNSYVVSVPELERFFDLARRTEMTFIDEAEVLEARSVVADHELAHAFRERVFNRVMTINGPWFVRDILHEIEDRRSRPPRGLNLKLSPGGLREIHLSFLAIRVVARLPGPFVPTLLEAAEEALPRHRGDLEFLLSANEALRRARELYRLVVAIDDEMEPSRMLAVAKHLKPLRAAGLRRDYGARIARLMNRVAIRIDRVARTLASRL